MARVDVGFAEFCEPWEVESRLFPSKIGGKPAWLDLEKLPSTTNLQCNCCKQQMIFLCQVYAPFEEDDKNFHRTVFLFACRNEACCKPNQNENFKVFRGTLPRQNKFYPFDPPLDQPDPKFTLSKWVNLCEMCGCSGTKQCSKCKKVFYCSREHQITDWKERHKHACEGGSAVKGNSSGLFPEMDIVIDEEEDSKEAVDEDKEMELYKKLEEEGKLGTLADISEKDLEEHAAVDADKVFTHFKKRVSQNPDQILRYDRGGEPLWIAESPRPLEIPACGYCKSPRQFEFQIMPQLLTVLRENSLDFGILAVYTCAASCTSQPGYKEEYVYKQDVSNVSIIDQK